MKTLARERDKAELLRRLRDVRSENVRRWGRMSAHQMVCHLTDSFRMMTGEKHCSRITGAFQGTMLKWVALYLPLSWPAGIDTTPEADQEKGGTKPIEFAADIAELERRIRAIASRRRNGDWPLHPIFGRMSEREWFRWAYLHTDHHLRQFGV
jgi:hypothetical protein